MDTLKELVDYMAYMKLNSLQLYVEHTFAFKEFADSVTENTDFKKMIEDINPIKKKLMFENTDINCFVEAQEFP